MCQPGRDTAGTLPSPYSHASGRGRRYRSRRSGFRLSIEIRNMNPQSRAPDNVWDRIGNILPIKSYLLSTYYEQDTSGKYIQYIYLERSNRVVEWAWTLALEAKRPQIQALTSVPQFPHFWKENTNSMCLEESLLGLRKFSQALRQQIFLNIFCVPGTQCTVSS